ncbi:GNAT family N-acetyltransferase [Meiothermus sp.]|uniref:GNAT family N-acetyltransferase n=1 Tax=Meiothermus sp. TaxID=1955249 RepID=UPI00307EFD8E
MGFTIRPYQPADLPELYRICLLTGDSGADASGLYRDPELLGHFYAAPYAIREPDLTFVLTDVQGVCGYVLGCRDSYDFAAWMENEWLPPLRQKYPLPPEGDTSRDAAMIRLIHKGYIPSRWARAYPAHLHIDLLPRAQGQGLGRKLMNTFLERLCEFKVRGVHLGVGRRNVGAVAFYRRVGFELLEEFPWGFEYGLKLEG